MQFRNLLPAAFAVAVAAQSDGSSEQDLTSLISSNPSLSMLGELLGSAPEVASALASYEGATLFAPSNEALMEVVEMGGIFSTDQVEMDSGLVEAILRYHTLQNEVTSDAVTAVPQFLPTLLNYTVPVMDGEVTGSNVTGGQVISISLKGENVVLNTGLKEESMVVEADLQYNNGVVHVIDTLLTIPMSVSGTLVPAGLIALAGAANATDLIPTLDGAADVTIFAPNNDAFAAIASATANLSTEDLADILTYHVVAGSVLYSTKLSEGSVETLNGGDITVTIEDDGAVFVNQARVINPDVLIAGGVVHIIDAVLMPSMPDAQPMPSSNMSVTATNVPFTSGVPLPTSTISELAAETSNVAAGIVSAAATGNSTTSATSPSMPEYTGGAGSVAVGYAALVGGAALAMF